MYKIIVVLELLVVVLFFPVCAVLQPVTEPTEKIVRRGSCISFDIPPITLTPVQTAAERQLLGENIEIEPEGWLIYSAQSSAYRSKSSQKGANNKGLRVPVELRRYYIEVGVLEYYEKTVSDYRTRQILGEGFDGKLRLVPYSFSRQAKKEERDIAVKVSQEVNRSREWLYRYHLKKSGAKEAKAVLALREKWLHRYFRSAVKRTGEWIYGSEKKWIITR